MSRLVFQTRRRVAVPPTGRRTIAIDAPPELPRLVPAPLLRRVLPYLIVGLVVGMVVALVATGLQLLSPTTLFFPFVLLLAATALYRGGDAKSRTEEVDAQRADYLRHLSGVRDTVRAHAAEQRTALLWSHPEPALLAQVCGTSRQWERDPSDPDFLVVRTGLHDVPLTADLHVADTPAEIDLEPVSHGALRSLLDVHHELRCAPTGIDLGVVARVTVVGERQDVRSIVRAWIAHAVTWHDPGLLGVALATPDLDGDDWSWLKWLPHVDVPNTVDGTGPARYLASTVGELHRLLLTELGDREQVSDRVPVRHLLIVVDDPDVDPGALASWSGLAGVTVVSLTSREPDHAVRFDPREPIVRVHGHRLERRVQDRWQTVASVADRLALPDARHLARRLSRWDSNPSAARSSPAPFTFTTLLGIADAAHLDVAESWAPRPRSAELRVPIGVTATGEPLVFDLKDEAEGGMGPHGLVIGMTGSGKSQLLMVMLLALLTTHSADRLIVIYADFKGEAGADVFRDFPQVVAVISNMADKRSLADRFADTLRGEVSRREQALLHAGRRVQGSAFGSVLDYEAAIAAGHDLPPMPTLLVVADEFSLMLGEHPHYAELFDFVARKGRSMRIHLLFASQTLDVGRIRDIDKNTSYRIGLKVASPSLSRQIIGVEDAFHIGGGPEHKGEAYLVPTPGAVPVKFRSTYVDGIYRPPARTRAAGLVPAPAPRVFTAAHVPAPARPTPAAAAVDDEPPPSKLIATVGRQLKRFGPTAPALWLPPLDEPIELVELLGRVDVAAHQRRWPLGEIDRPFEMRRDALVFDATSAGANLVIHGGPRSGKTTALQTFMLSAAALHAPDELSFYCLDYGGGGLRAVADLAHVGSIATPQEPERVRRTVGELIRLVRHRRHGPSRDDGFGEVFLVIDDLHAFGRADTDAFNTRNPLLNDVIELVTTGSTHGVHIAFTTSSWLEVPLAMRDGLGLRLELKLTDSRDSNVRAASALRRAADDVPADQPGRGITMAAEHFLFARPAPETIGAINARYPGRAAPPVRLLPALLSPRVIAPAYRGPDRVVIGQREEDLAAVEMDLARHPLVMVFGDAATGKTSFLRHVIRTVRQNCTAEQAIFTIVDTRLHLAERSLLPEDDYATDVDQVAPLIDNLTARLERRRPPADLGPAELSRWRTDAGTLGRAVPAHYLIIDDVDQIPDAPALTGPRAGRRPWTELIALLSQAAELRLRVLVTARASGSAQATMTAPLLRRLNDLQAAVVMLSGSPQDGGRIRGHRFTRLPTGRAVVLDDDDRPTFVQLVEPSADAHPTTPRSPGKQEP